MIPVTLGLGCWHVGMWTCGYVGVCGCVCLWIYTGASGCWKALICSRDFWSAKRQTAWVDPCLSMCMWMCVANKKHSGGKGRGVLVVLLINHLVLSKALVCPLPSLLLNNCLCTTFLCIPQISLTSLSLSDIRSQHFFLTTALDIILCLAVCFTLTVVMSPLMIRAAT